MVVNVLIETFSGLNLPKTLNLPLAPTTQISTLFSIVDAYLPPITTTLYLSTSSGKYLHPKSSNPISTLTNDFLTLRLTAPLPGGKGGFGSQLRAAGGRMSSRKRKGQENNDSCRNLDGRRMRTVKEAKALAQYLEVKPEMDKKEREKRKERWEKVIEAADEKIKGGGSKANERFDDVKWLEEKDEVRDRTREAVIRAMKSGSGRVPSLPGLNSDKSETSEELEEDVGEDDAEEGTSKSSEDDDFMRVKVSKPKKFVGFDDDEEFMSSSDEEEEEDEEEDDKNENGEEGMADIAEEEKEEEEVVGKGKGKAIAV